MHALVIGLWRNLGQTLPEVDVALEARETALLYELAQVREARRLVGAVMAAADIAPRPEPVEMSIAA